MAQRTMPAHQQHSTAQATMYNTEHWGAWLAAIAALFTGAVGLLIGFGTITWARLQDRVILDASFGNPAFWEGLVWVGAAGALAVLAGALHHGRHHAAAEPADGENRALLRTEHSFAWVAALGSVAATVIGFLVLYDAFGTGTLLDGLLWMAAAVGLSALAFALHAVGHHQPTDVVTDDHILGVVRRSGDYSAAAHTHRVDPTTGPAETPPPAR